MAGCSSIAGPSGSLTPRPVDISEAGTATQDPIVARGLAGVETTGGPFVSGEIVGYLVDYNVQPGGGGPIFELVAMKDGSVRRLDQGSIYRPRAAFGHLPADRLGPEPSEEAAAREQAVTNARQLLVAKFPDMASAVPQVFEYLVRLKRADASSIDVWVDASGATVSPMGPSALKDWQP